MDGYRLKIVTPDGISFDDDILNVVIRTTLGDVCIMKSHADFVSTIEYGRVTIKKLDGTTQIASCIGGFVSVNKGVANIVSTTFEFSEDIDIARAERAKERAEKLLAERKSDNDIKLAEHKLKRALNRINIAKTK